MANKIAFVPLLSKVQEYISTNYAASLSDACKKLEYNLGDCTVPTWRCFNQRVDIEKHLTGEEK